MRMSTTGNSKASGRGGSRSLVFQYIALMTAIAVVLIAIWCWLSYAQQEGQMESQMLAEARVLEQSVQATWDFIDYEQDNINYDADGSYNFKGLYCSLVGKSVGKLFTLSTDSRYVLRYTRLDPRNALDEPDAFERTALGHFYSSGTSEYFGFADNDEGRREFRYVGAIYLKDTCLDCHGGPAGELDVTGFVKEGLEAGDIGGAVSIVIPTDLYKNAQQSNTLLIVAFFVLFLTVTFGASLLFFRRKVTAPLNRLEDEVERIGQGDLKTPVSDRASVQEIDQLAAGMKAMASQLGKLYDTLEDQVAVRTEQYGQANRMLEEQRQALARANELLEASNAKLAEENEYRTNIVAILSHELRTPLTSILAFVDLWESSGEQHSRESRECLEKIKNQSQILLEMVNNALDMVRVESDQLELAQDTIDAVDLASTLVGAIQPIAMHNGVNLHFSVSEDVPLVRGDWAQMEKILTNLLSNAVKFTPEGGNVWFTTAFNPMVEESAFAGVGTSLGMGTGSETQTGDGVGMPASTGDTGAGSASGGTDASAFGRLVFTVADDGIGIEADRLDSIFDRFIQADASISRKYRGSGLGLSLVKKTTEALGGTVAVCSEVGKGSTFTVELPVQVIELSGDEE